MQTTLAVRLAFACILGPVIGVAAPPPKGSDDWNVMHEYSEWVRTRYGKSGQWCCDLSDGRPLDETEIRPNGDHWEFLFSTRHWADGDNRWQPIPPQAILNEHNPTGHPLVWAQRNATGVAVVYCAILPSGA